MTLATGTPPRAGDVVLDEGTARAAGTASAHRHADRPGGTAAYRVVRHRP